MSLKNTKTKTTSHSKYNINYHIVFCPKYRHNIFKDELGYELSKCFKVIFHCYSYALIEQEIMPDHVHLFISAPPTVAPVDIVKKLKSVSANEIFKGFPKLKQSKFWSSGLWSRGYYIDTAGTVSSETIQKYIQNQKNV
ncbi:transposase IS200 like protein [Clostridium tepidiprofundi DSM 19306]|uniref:Transposase IS200 like protein n=1 Tax=Clostridium tepidiprofundi DSM 19306 TaxID=1121338 RepID=A0A151AI07_9CLOT|nr:IS200/IS605 family transposase [Clostridium tepidiprofundi]KYH27316.1 transposase IS200 like protein [Clostridium tepidiprofundi DSM 19306]